MVNSNGARTNLQIRLRSRPNDSPGDECWEVTRSPIPQPGDGQLLVQVMMISVDPAMRGWMSDKPSYLPPVRLGDVMRAVGVALVVASNNPSFSTGDYVRGSFGVQEYAVSSGRGVDVLNPYTAPLASYLGPLGMPGMTAHVGLFDVGLLQPSETLVVSAAAGGVGGVAGQLAKSRGCHVVGIAGGREKCRHAVDELKYDACIDYKSENVRVALERECPAGIDVFFDNVGGAILEAGLSNLANGARVVLCGAVSQYNVDKMHGPSNYMNLLVNRASMTGFVVFDYADQFLEITAEIAALLNQGRLTSYQHDVAGIEQFPATLRSIFDGENTGKTILQISH